jgi:hypothetical protein
LPLFFRYAVIIPELPKVSVDQISVLQ